MTHAGRFCKRAYTVQVEQGLCAAVQVRTRPIVIGQSELRQSTRKAGIDCLQGHISLMALSAISLPQHTMCWPSSEAPPCSIVSCGLLT
jgi:hypothetical protein